MEAIRRRTLRALSVALALTPLWVVTLTAQRSGRPPVRTPKPGSPSARRGSRCFRPRAGRQQSDRLRQEAERHVAGERQSRGNRDVSRQRHQRRRIDAVPSRRRVGRLTEPRQLPRPQELDDSLRRRRAIPPARGGKPVRRAMRSASIARTARWDRSTTADSA